MSPKSVVWVGKLETQEESMLQFKSEGHVQAEFPLAQGRSTFCSIHSFNRLDEAHPHIGYDLLYTESSDSNVNLIQKKKKKLSQNNQNNI